MEVCMHDPKEIVKSYIDQELKDGTSEVEVKEEENLLANGIIDSLGVLKLVSFIEHKFNMQIPDEDVTVENFRSLKDIANYLETRKQQKEV
jgi:acyl carrier protein